MAKQPRLRILFDANPLVNNKKSGVGYYTEYLLHALAESDELDIVCIYSNFLNKKGVKLPEHKNISYRCNKYLPSKLINILRRVGLELPIELFYRRKVDFILYPNFVSQPSIRNTPSAVVVHDLGYLDCPQYLLPGNRSFLRRFVPRTLKRSEFYITISEFTKGSVSKHYGSITLPSVITPIPPVESVAKPQRPKSVTGDFILFLSTLEPRKNFIGLVRGYTELPKEIREKYALVLAGGSGWDVDDDLAEIARLQQKGENIIRTGYISEGERAWLLANADLFVMPSHYEGFGMPILEAMQVGVPTAVSNIPVFKEVASDASIYFDKDVPKDVARSLKKALTDNTLRKELAKKGYGRVNSISWDRNAKLVIDQIKSSLQ